MEKTSTFIYSIHNLATNTNHQLTDADDFDDKKDFDDIYKILDMANDLDVSDETIQKILKFADQTK